MSRFPRLKLRNLEEARERKEVKQATAPKAPKTHKTIRYVLILVAVALGSVFLLLLPQERRHMRKLKCTASTTGYSCQGYDYGDIIIKASDYCMQNIFDFNGLPFNVVQQNRAKSTKHIHIRDARPGCNIDVFHDSMSTTIQHGFVWIALDDHTEFTVYHGNEMLLEKVAGDFIPHTTKGKWTAYKYDATYVQGNGLSKIHIFNF